MSQAKVSAPVKSSSSASRGAKKRVRKNRKNNATAGGKKNEVQSRLSPKQFKQDLRRLGLSETNVFLSNVQNAVLVESVVDATVLSGVCMQYVTTALERGYLTFADNPSYPYWALNYMYSILASYVSAGTVAATDLPYWFLCLCHAVSPKEVPFQQGAISYAMSLSQQGYTPPALNPVGPIVFDNDWNVYVPGSVTADLFPIGISPDALPADGGLAAWNSLMEFMSDNDNGPQKGVNKIVPSSTATPYKKNVSAFAVPSAPEGGGFTESGGWGYNAQLEVPIMTPILGTFCSVDLVEGSTSPVRYPVFATASSGDSLSMTHFISTIHPTNWGFKRYVRYHPVDFLALGNVLALWVSALQNTFFTDPEVTISLANGGLQFGTYQCPLTLQEMLLLFRNEVMNAFKDTQSGVQSLFPNAPISDTDNVFVPFVSSATTCAQGSIGMKLPLSLVENIRSLVGRHIKGLKAEHDILSFIPVLGKMSQINLTASSYTYSANTTGSGPLSGPSFATEPVIELFLKDEKKGERWEKSTLAEPVINLVDGYTTSAPAGYVFINDQTRLQTLVSLWNNWLALGLDSYSDPLVQMGTETGINVLTSIGCTRHIIPTPTSTALAMTLKNQRDARVRVHMGGPNPYDGFQTAADTFRDRPLSTAYEQILSNWILPSNFIVIGTSSNDQTGIQRWQLMEGEPFTASRSSTGVQGPVVSQQHFAYAQKMVHSKGAQKNDWLELFETASAQGRGGVLSGLIAQFVGTTWGSTAGSIANAIASILPF